ncbi:glutamyl-tRNA synthetase [Colletotrichum plurivorum]|uniref:Glutamate--tRNA ligase, mitochondrial n=1 Tax=Colletotrichum plurivorum TaxID=2175906 RepID=A0A8H6NGR7_9PEZI|nr:glutamyl-tRNA synthetase [Colletotrichum plurivorum]
MSTIALRPLSRSLFQKSSRACQPCCRAGTPRWHSSKSGFNALREKLPPLNHDKLGGLPDKPARTRFAPSPTGYLHLGSLRTALFNWLLARATGGQFIIRVEDTDRTRIVEDAVERLFSDLKWAELDWDEAPDIGGAYGPYVQSERLHHYQTHVSQLLESGKAYRCFCSQDELSRHKMQSILDNKQSGAYPGTCRSISPSVSERRAAGGEQHVVRFRSFGRPSFIDSVYGRYQRKEDEPDFILIKSDGYPTYHFANVVDDHLMEITHVIRGAEWLISTPMHISLYEAFKWTPPTFAHVGLLCNEKGEKLSKRNQDIDVSSYRDKGILPSALNNWLALLGWSMDPKHTANGKGEVIYPLSAMPEKFSMKFTKGSARANPKKLDHFQRFHVSHALADPNYDQAALRRQVVDPVAAVLSEVTEHLRDKTELQLASPHNPKHVISTPDFSEPVPQLASGDPAAAGDYILRALRGVRDLPSGPAGLVYDHPSMFFRPSPRAYALHADEHSNARLAKLADVDADPWALLRELRAAIEAVPEAEWTEDRLQAVIDDFCAANTAAVRAAREAKAKGEVVGEEDGGAIRKTVLEGVYQLLKLVLTGDPGRGARPAKMQLAILGRDESLLRFKMCCDP